jgi:dipeptidyl aminopeptidase/acylaminoacyl peptidase
MALLDVDHNAAYAALSAGDLRSPVIKAKAIRDVEELRLTQRVPETPINLPAGQVLIDFPSPSLSAFWERPTRMRGMVVLPPGYETSKGRYPTIFFIPGYGASMGELSEWAGTAQRRGHAEWRSSADRRRSGRRRCHRIQRQNSPSNEVLTPRSPSL